MKRVKRLFLSTFLTLLLLLICACGPRLSGTYYIGDIQTAGTFYTFTGDNISARYYSNGVLTHKEGKYSLEKDQITITFKEKDGVETTNTYSFKEDKQAKTITIGKITYNKEIR
ncbi:hypothetical protein GX831_03525 [bacterium]|jgi:uncharacterized lipoprotein YehR (DUF1307 family)|nr:hypothetical protein [bacterium]